MSGFRIGRPAAAVAGILLLAGCGGIQWKRAPVVRWMVPGDGDTGSRAAPAPAGVEHYVLPGQTLSEIARRYGVSADSIRATNGLRAGEEAVAGYWLRIPSR